MQTKKASVFSEVIEWFDPAEVKPDADILVMICDRLGCVSFASWDYQLECWIEEIETNHGGCSYHWAENHCHAWADLPSGPAV